MMNLTSGLSSVDPHGWMVSLPVLVVMLAIVLQPAGSTLRRWGRGLLRAEASAWAVVTGQMTMTDDNAEPWPAWRSGLLCAATTALTLATLLSMARFAGLLG